MKYIKYLLLFLLLMPFVIKAESNNVEIKDIILIDKSKMVEEFESAKFSGLNLKFDLVFKKLNNYAKYKVIIKNSSDKDYEIDNSEVFNEGKFIKYEFIVDDDNKILKANSELVIYVNISYVKEIDEDKFVNNIYQEDNNVSLELSKKEESNISEEVKEEIKEETKKEKEEEPHEVIKFVVNPNTSTGYTILLIIAVLLSILVIIFIRNKKIKMYMLMLLFIMPITVYALDKIKLEVDTHVEIEKVESFVLINWCLSIVQEKYQNGYLTEEEYEEGNWEQEVYDYRPGMTFDMFLESNYFKELSEVKKNRFYTSLKPHSYLLYASNEYLDCMSEIEYPVFYDNMTDEEIEEFWDLYNIAMDAERACRNYYYGQAYLQSSVQIISSKEGKYKSNLYCPN